MNVKLKYIIPKVKNRIQSYIAKLSEHLPVEKISLCGIDHVCGKADLMDRLERMLGGAIPDTIRNAKVEDVELILGRANESKQRIFNVLGSGPVKMASINWSREIKTGFEWPVGTYYLKQRVLTPKGSDIKVPWEISRCHHLLWMAEAYCLIGDESYAEEVVSQIRHWVKNNPLMYSVNWSCAMDVSIRAVNWMYALVMIGGAEAFTDEFAKEVYKSLYQHMYFVNHNIEKCIPQSNNHYFSDIVGQLYLGQLFSTTQYGKRTLRHAFKEYIKETELQVFPSGVDYERSVSYHRLMTELVMYPYYMLCRIGHKPSALVADRLSHMLGYVNQYTMADGCSPMVADNDDGRLLPLVPLPFMKHSYLARIDSLDSCVASISCKWIAPAYNSSESCLHADANLAILKKGKFYLFTSCFNRWRRDQWISAYTATHLHNDLLSFVFADGHTTIITDAGAYCYTSDIKTWRSFRTAKKHNTVFVDNEEPNLLGNNAFMMKYNSYAKPMSFSTGTVMHCEGEYTTIEGQMTHHRVFDLSSDCLTITDHVIKSGIGHKVYMSFHFSDSIVPSIEGDSIFIKGNEKQYSMKIESSSKIQLHIENDTISPSFGKLVETKTLVVEIKFENHVEFTTKIERLLNMI